MADEGGFDWSRPASVEQIVKQAQDYSYDPVVPLRYWIRTATTLLKEAEIYDREGNDAKTYFLLFRHARLVLSNLSKHPEARLPQYRSAITKAEKQVQNNLSKLESIRPRINDNYKRHVKQSIAEQARRRALLESRPTRERVSKSFSSDEQTVQDTTVSRSSRVVDAKDNKDLAVRVAQKEVKRRATARKATRKAGISAEEEHRRRSGRIWGDWEDISSKEQREKAELDDDLCQRIQDVGARLEGNKAVATSSTDNEKSNANMMYQYPLVPSKSEYTSSSLSSNTAYPSFSMEPLQPQIRPSLPPKIRIPDSAPLPPVEQSHPPLPSKPPALGSMAMSPSDTAPETSVQSNSFTFKPSAYLENGTPLRTIVLPRDLRQTFLRIASSNTSRNLETCGILSGTLIRNALFILKLVIPDQINTSDTCEMVNESDLFDYCDKEDLMTLGWIHTHPTQTCFMSSRDLHTHCGYQVMMPESIAIVCAPSRGEWGVFRLTDPPGLKAILNCSKPGIFHPHDVENLYTEALRPGHVLEMSMQFEVIDLRTGH